MVRVMGETWFAKSEGRPIADGEDIVVTSSSGLSLKVRALNETAQPPVGASDAEQSVVQG